MHTRSCTCSVLVVDTNQYIAIQASPATPRHSEPQQQHLPTGDPVSQLAYSPPSPRDVSMCPPTPRATVSDDDRPIGGEIPGSSTVAAPTIPGILDAAEIGGSQVRSAKRGRSPVVKFEPLTPVCAPLELTDSD